MRYTVVDLAQMVKRASGLCWHPGCSNRGHEAETLDGEFTFYCFGHQR